MEATGRTDEPSLSPKAEQILDAARHVFLEQGYGAASMDTIAQTAGVSKATVYAHFASKDQLFAEMIGAECRRHAQMLGTAEIDRLDVATALRQIGRKFLELVLSPHALAIHRVVTAEVPRFPELGRIFYDSGPRMVLDRLAAYLRHATERGALDAPDPRQAAEQFLGMLKGELHLRRMLGLSGEITEEEIAHVVDGAVRMFVRAYAVE